METLSVSDPSLDEALSTGRVYLVDDDPLVLTAVKDALLSRGFNPITFDNAADFLAAINPLETGCVVSDLRMPGIDGVALQQALIDRDSNLTLIMLTAFADVPLTVEVMSKGALTLLEKPFKVERLTEEVYRAIKSSNERHAITQRTQQARQAIAQLTDEEIAVMDCAVQGKSNKVTGSELSLSSRTVDRRRQSAMRKLDAGSVSDYAVLRAIAKNEAGIQA